MISLQFYYKEGCHLCDDMWLLLQQSRQERDFDLDSVEINSDPEFLDKFGDLIPVLASGDIILCHYFLDPVALDKHLDEMEQR